MKNRVRRHLEIRRIISKGNVGSQEEILAALRIKGFEITQATLSRDLKYMQVARIHHPVSGYVYAVPGEVQPPQKVGRAPDSFLIDGFMGLEYSGNLAVMRTLPGYASTIATVIDSARQWEILGTVAGDDTILIVRREGTSVADLNNALVSIIPKLKNRL